MKLKKCISAIMMLSAFCRLSAQDVQLKFNDEGQFKIAQFTDMHLVLGASEYCDVQAEKTFARLKNVVETESPDFLVFTGDIVAGGVASEGWGALLDSLNSYKIPFCVVFGNHDPENELTRAQMSALIAASPYSLNELNSVGELADMELEVLPSKKGNAPFVMYCMDSHDYSKIPQAGYYGWFEREQVQWLIDRCGDRTKSNGGKPVPSMAFFHICLQEFGPAWNNPHNSHIGRKAENECPGALNTGMFAGMVETGSIMAVFVGHDHDNDYVVAEKGIALGYGRFSGGDTVYNNLRPGARIIVVNEGHRSFDSWIREDDGRVVDKMTFKDGKIINR